MNSISSELQIVQVGSPKNLLQNVIVTLQTQLLHSRLRLEGWPSGLRRWSKLDAQYMCGVKSQCENDMFFVSSEKKIELQKLRLPKCNLCMLRIDKICTY